MKIFGLVLKWKMTISFSTITISDKHQTTEQWNFSYKAHEHCTINKKHFCKSHVYLTFHIQIQFQQLFFKYKSVHLKFTLKNPRRQTLILLTSITEQRLEKNRIKLFLCTNLLSSFEPENELEVYSSRKYSVPISSSYKVVRC